ncbi:hypothetical protein OEZ86_008792 [Tetradesmus obliquus]|nr:hypothetical protein OEZ86_008792 [Tetradesmus obliquus]
MAAKKRSIKANQESENIIRGDHGGSPRCNGVAAEHKVPAAAAADTINLWQSRCRPQLAVAVGVVFLLLPALQAYLEPPSAFWQYVLAACLFLTACRVITFERWGHELPYVRRFLACFAAMVAELLVENLMVWVVSATDARNQELVPGLQDNGEALLHSLAGSNGWLHFFIHGKWFDIKHFLGAILLLAFSNMWEQHPFSSFGMMARFSLTICVARLLRTACFMSTVLPSPTPGCYMRRFPPPPRSWFGIVWIGVTELRGFGGCNDLIFSGHASFWTVAPLMFCSYYPNRFSSPLLWLALLQTCIRDIIDRQHYTVDMILAVAVTTAAWGWTRRVYPEDAPLPSSEGEEEERPTAAALLLVVVGLATAAVAVFVAKS